MLLLNNIFNRKDGEILIKFNYFLFYFSSLSLKYNNKMNMKKKKKKKKKNTIEIRNKIK